MLLNPTGDQYDGYANDPNEPSTATEMPDAFERRYSLPDSDETTTDQPTGAMPLITDGAIVDKPAPDGVWDGTHGPMTDLGAAITLGASPRQPDAPPATDDTLVLPDGTPAPRPPAPPVVPPAKPTTGAMPIEIDGQPWTATPVDITDDEDDDEDKEMLRIIATARGAALDPPFLT